MPSLDKRQWDTLVRFEIKSMILGPLVACLSSGLGLVIDRWIELIQFGKNVDSIAGWFACGFTCAFIAHITYGTEFVLGTMPYLATRPVSYQRVFKVKLSCGLIAAFLVSVLGKLVFMLSNPVPGKNFESTWSASFDFGWWYLGPCAYLAAMTAILAIPSMIPANAGAFIASFLVFFLGQWFLPLPLLLCPILLFVCYRLAYYRRLTQWAVFD